MRERFLRSLERVDIVAHGQRLAGWRARDPRLHHLGCWTERSHLQAKIRAVLAPEIPAGDSWRRRLLPARRRRHTTPGSPTGNPS